MEKNVLANPVAIGFFSPRAIFSPLNLVPNLGQKLRFCYSFMKRSAFSNSFFSVIKCILLKVNGIY